MVRRPESSESDGPQKDNAPQERAKSRTGTVKQEKMSRNARGSVARRAEDEPEEDEQDARNDGHEQDVDVDDEQGASPRGRKRVRLNADGDSAPAPDETRVAKREHTQTLPRDTDGYALLKFGSVPV